jgi:uncharacterized protein (DUF1499 family)
VRWPSQRALMIAGLALALASVLTLLAAGPAYRVGLWPFQVSMLLMQGAAFGGLAAMAVSLAAAIVRLRRRLPIFRCLVGLLLGAVSAGMPLHQLRVARSVPPIHDITTDTAQPPQFVAVVGRRGAGSNPLDYGGPELAAQQQAAYPDLQPLILQAPVAEAASRALAAAQAMGWEVVASDPGQGRIEATDTTFWFGFRDDVVIRVTALDAQRSRVDVRSVSRVGQSDLGANAARIRKYLAALKVSS